MSKVVFIATGKHTHDLRFHAFRTCTALTSRQSKLLAVMESGPYGALKAGLKRCVKCAHGELNRKLPVCHERAPIHDRVRRCQLPRDHRGLHYVSNAWQGKESLRW